MRKGFSLEEYPHLRRRLREASKNLKLRIRCTGPCEFLSRRIQEWFRLERYPHLRRWLWEASKDQRLRVICVNILSEFFFRNIPQAEFQEVFSKLDGHIKKRRKEGHQIEHHIEGFDEKEHARKGQQVEVGNDEIYSRVLLLEKIRAHCVAPGFDWDFGIKIDSGESIQTFEDLINQHNEQIEQHNEQKTVLINFTGKKDIFWFTKAELLQVVKQANRTGNKASSVRNALGLCSECTALVEIQFQSDYVKDGKKPTIFDSGLTNLFFRPKNRKYNWGFALDSEDLTESVPEAVHEKKEVWPRVYKWEILGSPGPLKSPPEEKWKELRKDSLHVLCTDYEVDRNTVCRYIVCNEVEWT